MEILAFVALFLLAIMFFSLIVAVISIIGLWKMFEKAGEEGWKSIIPIYNVYTLCTIVGVSPYWLLILVATTFFNALPGIGSIIDGMAMLYFCVIMCVSTAKSFGRNEDFAIGLFFLPFIFNCILGFGKTEYVGPTPMSDPVGDWILGLFNKENTTKNNTSNRTNNTNKNVRETEVLEETEVNFCRKCGAKIEDGDAFCVSCGTKIN